MPPGVRRVLMRKEILTSAKLEAHGSARHSQFNLCAQTAFRRRINQQVIITSSMYRG